MTPFLFERFEIIPSNGRPFLSHSLNKLASGIRTPLGEHTAGRPITTSLPSTTESRGRIRRETCSRFQAKVHTVRTHSDYFPHRASKVQKVEDFKFSMSLSFSDTETLGNCLSMKQDIVTFFFPNYFQIKFVKLTLLNVEKRAGSVLNKMIAPWFQIKNFDKYHQTLRSKKISNLFRYDRNGLSHFPVFFLYFYLYFCLG